MLSELRLTVMPAVAIVIPLPEAAVIPAITPSPVIVTDLVIISGPYPAESRATTSPPDTTASCARWKLRHGDVRVQGFKSSPRPETNTRFCACVAKQEMSKKVKVNAKRIDQRRLFILFSYVDDVDGVGFRGRRCPEP